MGEAPAGYAAAPCNAPVPLSSGETVEVTVEPITTDVEANPGWFGPYVLPGGFTFCSPTPCPGATATYNFFVEIEVSAGGQVPVGDGFHGLSCDSCYATIPPV